MAPNTRFQTREGPLCSYFPCPVWRVLGCPFSNGSRLVILKAVPKPASECEELVEISHVRLPVRHTFVFCLPLLYFWGLFFFFFIHFPILAFLQPSCLLLTKPYSSPSRCFLLFSSPP